MESITRNTPSILGNNKTVLYAAMMKEHDPSISNQMLDASLAIQLAALIHNQQYKHAHNLYSRYQDAHIMRNTSAISRENVFPMFFRLWNALEPLFKLYDFHSETSECANLSLRYTLPRVYGDLKSCEVRQNRDCDQFLLKSLASELITSTREKFLYIMESGGFDTVSKDTVSLLLGFSDDENVVSFCESRGWQIEIKEVEIFMIPCMRDNIQRDTDVLIKNSEKIEYLTKLVAFLETEKLNA